MDYNEEWPFMAFFYIIYKFLRSILKLCYNEQCYKEVYATNKYAQDVF